MSARKLIDIAQGFFKLIDSVKELGSRAMSTFRQLRREHRERKSTKIIVSGNTRGMHNILRHLKKKRKKRQDQS